MTLPNTSDQTTTFSAVPHSLEAEEAVIGSVLINPEIYDEISEFLKAEHFYLHRLKFIWEAFDRLHEKRIPLDILTLTEEVNAANQLVEIGGEAYITTLLGCVPTSLHAEAYAKTVHETFVRRNLLTAASGIADLAYDLTKDLDGISSEAVETVSDAVSVAMVGISQSSAEVASELYDFAEEMSHLPGNVLPGVGTGIPDLDVMLNGGWQPGTLNLVGGRPGEGKTALILSMLHHAAFEMIHPPRVAFFGLEMSNKQNATRLISMDSGINGQLITTGKLSEENWVSFNTSIEKFERTPIRWDDASYLTPAQMLARSKRIRALYGLDLIIVDYLGLMSPNRARANRYEEVTDISRQLKIIARELGIPVVAAQQLSRGVEARYSNEPQLSDLRESGGLEQDADTVSFIYRDRSTGAPENRSILKVAKHRNGPVGYVNLVFQRQLTKLVSEVHPRMAEAEPSYFERGE